MQQKQYTQLPWEKVSVISVFTLILTAVFIVFLVVCAILHRKSTRIRKGHMALFQGYISALFCSVLSFCYMYWYWAVPLSLLLSAVFLKITSDRINAAHTEELCGMWGLMREICIIRGEMFSDLSPEQQLEYKKSVKKPPLLPVLFMAVCVGVPFLFIFCMWLAGTGYLFFPILV